MTFRAKIPVALPHDLASVAEFLQDFAPERFGSVACASVADDMPAGWRFVVLKLDSLTEIVPVIVRLHVAIGARPELAEVYRSLGTPVAKPVNAHLIFILWPGLAGPETADQIH